ncbi:nucleotide exchange factor GrpE [Occallatibacter riparius]|uniref:Protein GrpE n=1 Tax=Occallatibacter riparius TaxID=1002689 RepID=A0A9J7BMB9_9BACT|nr:nucleotide exchange factor GrpE [Occallatibacter riparius]UWZ84028.1 nucleotide exchange factor GrpE [Occallatibacter riparius]
MSKQEAAKKEVATNDLGSAQTAENAANDAAASEAATVPDAGTEAAAGAESASAADPQSVESAAEETVPRSQYDQLKAERDQLVDRLARMQAEFENARKRAEREKADYRDYATAGAVEQFLPVLDNFELALKATGTVEQMRSGVELIVKQMEEILRQMNVTPVAAVGEEFNPHHHEALGSVERLDLPDQHVAEEIRRGYKIREKLLRPALVRVVSNPKQTVE